MEWLNLSLTGNHLGVFPNYGPLCQADESTSSFILRDLNFGCHFLGDVRIPGGEYIIKKKLNKTIT